MKKMVIFFPKLSLGGMERSLVEWIKNEKLRKEFCIDLYLGYVKSEELLEEIKPLCRVHLLCKGKWTLINKVFCFIKMKLLGIKYRIFGSKYDVAVSYSYQHKILSRLTLAASDNTILYIHADLEKSRTPKQLIKMKKDLKILKYKKIVCVSENTKNGFLRIYPDYLGKVYTIYNYVNGKYIIEKSKEKIEDLEFDNSIWFINISRQEEEVKHISYLIYAAEKLHNKELNFRLLLIGNGKSHEYYKALVKELNLEKNVILLGDRVNPYKYLANCDVLVVSSPCEGYGVVFDEARVLDKVLISSDVGDYKLIAADGYGILCSNSVEGFYKAMKDYIINGYSTKKFDYNAFNKEIENRTLDMLND